jgi:hypothetical protein
MILLMGTKEEDFLTPPPQPIKFVEDMNESELATAVRTRTSSAQCEVAKYSDIHM